MPSRFTIPVPADFNLPRDACSYGYFLLFPNNWDPAESVFTRILDLKDGPATLRITQAKGAGAALRVDSGRTLSGVDRNTARDQITRMFRLDEDKAHADRFHGLDPRFKKSGRFRLMRSPTLFEDVIKTVTSCNVTWGSTILMNRRLCECFGRSGAFPTPQKLARTAPALLRGRCSVGYRDTRIVELAMLFSGKKVVTGIKKKELAPVDAAWLEDPATPDDQVFEALLELPGIGPYAAANIMQLLGRYSRLPLDTESVRHGKMVLGFRGSSAQIMKRVHKHFAPMEDQAFRSYWFELWTFYEAKHGPAWTWQRDSTGKMFTAAQLSK
ncbi:MAG: hypothetical protein IT435_04840 [Phycisphaerales bacterium]|nr:hypothetical protein [Phycisphaerales bacterium]